MQIENPLQMNDWEMKRFLRVILAIQLALFGVFAYDYANLSFPLVRAVVGFTYVTFVPGIVLLRILRLHKLGNLPTMLYSVGLSISVAMLLGLFMNSIYPLLGVTGPISAPYYTISMSVLVLILLLVSYVRDRDYAEPEILVLNVAAVSPIVLSWAIFSFTMAGVTLFNLNGTNYILLIVLGAMALVVILVAFDKLEPRRFLPLVIVSVSASLLLHHSLVSPYLVGWDIQHEYYLSNLVMSNSRWDSAMAFDTNGMLSIVILAPAYSFMCGMSLVWVFKIIYPLLFSLVPVILFLVIQRQTNPKIAFMSVFFFVSFFTFYFEMVQLARQEIAEVFLALLLLLILDARMARVARSFLMIVFSFSLIVSHYGLSYFFMFALIVVWLYFLLFRPSGRNLPKHNGVSGSYVLFYSVSALLWYSYISSSSSLASVVNVADVISRSFFEDFLRPESAQGFSVLLSPVLSPLHLLSKYLHLVTQCVIAVGVLSLVRRPRFLNIGRVFYAFSSVALVIMFATIAVPYFGSALNTSRMYQIGLIFLSPFLVVGTCSISRFFGALTRVLGKSRDLSRSSQKVLSVFLAFFLLFNSGFIYEITNDHPVSTSLNSGIDSPIFNEVEMATAKWLMSEKNESIVYGDVYRSLLIASFEPYQKMLPPDLGRIESDSYIFQGTFNIDSSMLLVIREHGVIRNLEYINATDFLFSKSMIVDSGGASVYMQPS